MRGQVFCTANGPEWHLSGLKSPELFWPCRKKNSTSDKRTPIPGETDLPSSLPGRKIPRRKVQLFPSLSVSPASLPPAFRGKDRSVHTSNTTRKLPSTGWREYTHTKRLALSTPPLPAHLTHTPPMICPSVAHLHPGPDPGGAHPPKEPIFSPGTFWGQRGRGGRRCRSCFWLPFKGCTGEEPFPPDFVALGSFPLPPSCRNGCVCMCGKARNNGGWWLKGRKAPKSLSVIEKGRGRSFFFKLPKFSTSRGRKTQIM